MRKNIIILLSVLAQSCSFLDLTPTDFLYPESFYTNEQECTMALSGVYSTLSSLNLYGLSYSCSLSNSDDLSFYTRPNRVLVAVNNYGTGASELADTWGELYEGINNANLLLESIDKAKFDNERNREIIRGEAKFLRAYYHFLLVQAWYEVPIRKHSTKDIQKSPLEATPNDIALDWIISEMEACINLVDDETYNQSPSHIKKTVVEGILARVCLWRAGYPSNGGMPYYEKARYYANCVYESGVHHLNKVDIYALWKNMASDRYDTDNNESMWEVEFVGSRNDGKWTEGRIGANIGNLQQNTSTTGLGYSYAYYAGTLLLWDLFEPNDLRRDLSMAPYYYNKNDNKISISTIVGRYCGKYRREWDPTTVKNKNFTNNNYCILRYADVLLMLAEAENEVNMKPTTLAYEAINEVRTRAGVSMLPEGMSYSKFKEEVQNERGRELCFESIRRFDLIRWGIYYKRIKTDLKQALQDPRWDNNTDNLKKAPQQYVDNTEEKHIFFPIPARELAVNPLLKQNKYWK